MKSMALYVDKDSIIHDIDPITKLFYVFVSISITYILPIYEVAFIAIAASAVLLLFGKVFWKIIPIIGLSMILMVSIIIIQGIFHPDSETPLFSIAGITFYQEGMSYALLLALRISNMLCAFGILILTTRSDKLIEALIQRGISPKIGYVFLSILQIIPQMIATMGKIIDAQRSRGLETEGNLLVRIRVLLPLIGPVVLRSLNNTRERAIAIEVRGFNTKGKRSFINVTKVYKYSKIIQIMLMVILIFAVTWRFIL